MKATPEVVAIIKEGIEEGMYQKDIAEAVGLSQSQVSKIVNSKKFNRIKKKETSMSTATPTQQINKLFAEKKELTVKKIRKTLNLNHSQVMNRLVSMNKAGVIERIGRGTYRLAPTKEKKAKQKPATAKRKYKRDKRSFSYHGYSLQDKGTMMRFLFMMCIEGWSKCTKSLNSGMQGVSKASIQGCMQRLSKEVRVDGATFLTGDLFAKYPDFVKNCFNKILSGDSDYVADDNILFEGDDAQVAHIQHLLGTSFNVNDPAFRIGAARAVRLVSNKKVQKEVPTAPEAPAAEEKPADKDETVAEESAGNTQDNVMAAAIYYVAEKQGLTPVDFTRKVVAEAVAKYMIENHS